VLIFAGLVLIGRRLYASPWTTLALVAAFTLRHHITRTSANTFEPYFHPRMLAFGVGVLAVAAFAHRRHWLAITLVVAAGAVHNTTGAWFALLIGAAIVVLEPAWRRLAVGAAIAGAAVAVWALLVPLHDRLVVMDDLWLQAVASKDSLFANEWPLSAWAINLGTLGAAWAACGWRRAHGRASAEERALVWGATALVAVFPDESGGYDVIARFFVPAERIRERSRRDHVPYEEWVKQGHLEATTGWGGTSVDYEAIRRQLAAWREVYNLELIAFDTWNATELVSKLEKIDGFALVPVRQGFASLSAPTKSLEPSILSKRLRHDGNPIMRWCVANTAVETDAAGNLKPSKERSHERIDGVVALIMAVDCVNRLAAVKPPAFLMTVV